MDVHIGVPQALLYHEFGSLWTDFFARLNVPVSLSGETTKKILDRGTVLAVDESCLPLKVYLGHVDALLPTCTHIFVPHIVQYHRNFHFCAKFAGLPDIVKNTFGLREDQVISPSIEDKSPVHQLKAVYKVCRELGLSVLSGQIALRQALSGWRTSKNNISKPEGAKVALIGHSYLTNDPFFCQDIVKCLSKQGNNVITPDNVPASLLYKEAAIADPEIYWQLSAKLAGATRYLCRQDDVAGIILLSSFGCGPDSLINEYLEYNVLRNCGKPFIVINIDEHTGSAGVITRIEAFGDLVKWRVKS